MTAGSRFQWRLIDPCVATRDGRQCEREAHQDGDHWYSAWALDEATGEMYPSHPVTWPQASLEAVTGE